MTADRCQTCHRTPPIYSRQCVVCQTHVGFPNVRLSRRPGERQALQARILDLDRSNAGTAANATLARLKELAGSSPVVFNRSLGALFSWVVQNPLFPVFAQQVAGGRMPEDNQFDRQRMSFENAVSPNFSDQLSIGALAPDGLGMSYYGPYSVVLDEVTIVHRASVFERNPFYFCQYNGIIAGDDVPEGFRASWSARGDLAVAKLGPKVSKSLTDKELKTLLMGPDGTLADCDFIEVHIYGPIHRDSIKSVIGPSPKDRDDRALWRKVKRALVDMGVEVRETA